MCDATVGLEEQEVVFSLRVINPIERNGGGGALVHRVSGEIVIKDVHKGPEFKREKEIEWKKGSP